MNNRNNNTNSPQSSQYMAAAAAMAMAAGMIPNGMVVQTRKSRRCRCPNCLAGIQPASGT